MTPVIATIIDVAPRLERAQLKRMIDEADRLDLVAHDALRLGLDAEPRRPGLGIVRRLLDEYVFLLTDSELEHRFLRLVRAAGLPVPRAQAHVNGFRVDFWWPELRLVVETDGLRYHRTPAQQMRDRVRDQRHAAAGVRTLRFTHQQVAHEPEYVVGIIRAVAAQSP